MIADPQPEDWTPDDDAIRAMLALTPKQRVDAMLRIVRFAQRTRPIGSAHAHRDPIRTPASGARVADVKSNA